MKIYDMIGQTNLRAYSAGHLEECFLISCCDQMTVRTYTFADGFQLRVHTNTYQRHIDKALTGYIRQHGEIAGTDEQTISREQAEQNIAMFRKNDLRGSGRD